MIKIFSSDIISEIQLYSGLPLFVFIVLLGSTGFLFFFLEFYYIFIERRSAGATSIFVREGMVEFRWLIWLLVTTDLFLIANNLLVRGLAVGIWDVDGYFYPYY